MGLAVLAALFVTVKAFGPAWIEALFRAGHYAFLNAITFTQGDPGLDFYLGRSRETFLGPILQIVSAWWLVVFIARYAAGWSTRRFFLLIFLFIIGTRPEALMFPLYGDAIGGPFAEAWWLAHHGFDYPGLFQEPGYAEGGAKVYIFSIFPTYLALTMRLFRWTPLVLAVNHLVFFAMGAAMVAVLRDMIRRVIDEPIASWGSLILLFSPLFQSQTEAINMEIPCAFFLLLSMRALQEGHMNRAGIFSVLATLVKGSGVIGPAVVGGTALLRCLLRENRRTWKSELSWAAGLFIMGFFIVAVKFFLKDQHAAAGMIRCFRGWPSLLVIMVSRYFLAAVAVIALVGLGRFMKGGWWRAWFEQGRHFYSRDLAIVFGCALAWFLLFLNFYAVSPRYQITLYPFLLYLCIVAACLILTGDRARGIACVVAVTIAGLIAYGPYRHPRVDSDHVQLEEDLGYRSDMELNRRIARVLEERYPTEHIVAPFITAQMLALPEVGYMRQHREVTIYGFACRYGGIRTYAGWDALDLSQTVFVGQRPALLGDADGFMLTPRDEVLETIQWGHRKAVIFRGGVLIEYVYRRMHGAGRE